MTVESNDRAPALDRGDAGLTAVRPSRSADSAA
jgi:hypothetical protein